MATANVTIYFQGNVVSETTVSSNQPKIFDESLIEIWTNHFRENKLTLRSLKIDAWDTIEFNVEGTTYSRNYSE